MKPDHRNSEADASQQRRASSRSSSSAPETRKLRLSCDNCFLAKVKCSKERPTCLRCVNLGHNCVYSLSRRAGKPRSSRSGASGACTASPPLNLPHARAAGSPSDMDLLLQHRPWNFDQSDARALPSPTGPPEQPMPLLSNLEKSNLNTFNTNSNVSYFHNHGNSISCAACQPPTLSTWLDTCFDHNVLNQSSISSSTTTDGAAPAFNDDRLATMGRQLSTFSSLTPSTDEFSAILTPDNMHCLSRPLSTKLDDFPAEVGSDSCNCSTALHETLSMLYSPSTSFDHLLAVNKTAVNRVTHHFSCTCPPDISSIMLLSVIITKIMHWYSRSRDGNGLQEVCLTLGTYKMDKEDEQRIKLALVRSELRKVEMLLGRFRERFERSLDGYEKELYEANMAFLERKLYDTIKGL